MQIRCAHCTKTIALAAGGELPPACPHCARGPGPGPLGPFDPLRLIAAGGMGEVYLARHRELGTEVALKVLPAVALDAAAALRARLAREARLTARVLHPGVVKVHACELAGDRPYLVLEFVAGRTLRQWLASGPLPVVEAARVVAATADVLAAAHAHGVLHRDIKPDNVMVAPDGAVRVLDFGIARGLHDDAPLTRTGELVGTPEYMAPEQLLDGPEATTERTDVHACGVLAYELLTGRSPFHGANVFQALKLVEALVPQPPSALRADVPPALDAVVARALAKQPADRFASAAALAAAVRDAVPQLLAPQPAAAPRTRRLWPIAILAAGSLALVATAALLLYHGLVVGLVAATFEASTGPALRAAFAHEAVAAELARGEWTAALHLAAAQADDVTMQDLGREAFVLAHTAWPRATGAPAWLALADERGRARWFGDRLERPGTDDATMRAWRRLLGDEPANAPATAPPVAPASPGAARVAAAGPPDHDTEVAGTAAPATAGDAGADDDDALARLLRAAGLPFAARADAFAATAQRLPLTAPEHWLARCCEHHHRGDPVAGSRAAEHAWLAGAGEVAVLLDAWLHIAPRDDGALRTTDRWQIVRARVAAADPVDSPAGALLVLLLDALHGAPLALAPARVFPAPARTAAAAWFVASAAAAAPAATRAALLHVAVALGAAPDWAAAPWRDVAEPARTALAAEAQRGR